MDESHNHVKVKEVKVEKPVIKKEVKKAPKVAEKSKAKKGLFKK